jgi:hypothetical protein
MDVNEDFVDMTPSSTSIGSALPERAQRSKTSAYSQVCRQNVRSDDWVPVRRSPLGIGEIAMRDTSEPAQERYYELLRARTPLARLTTAVSLSCSVRRLAESSIRAADPSAEAGVVRARLAMRLYGRQVAARLFPGVNLDVG